ncbi:insulinase family protein [Riemerella anatipestifer]|uniref:Insulinase family protein n=1 Tax=Riemerella anatipestifer TaxID=34085 RepID=A0AAP3AKF6_RIEAN|nr:M16 family metallopeptidase [Riemerella anatipestifer]AZZ58586.1 insulinase family protein [Riemerella anatipestifer]MCO7319552.1 insulinase family protein [Riemerella anatipestifer]MCQ4155882.1 insulinase family protein [Riemerella anatipestifer]MCQ4181802.1 insulinase family protein [Riemerella anatipestifer]MCU7567689.1 insulinase family protein [Riemerella anatipestifer]
MRLKKSFILLMLFLSLGIFAQNYEWKSASSAGYDYKYVTSDPMKARFYTLKNGLTVILSPTPKDPRIQCYIAIKAGSKTDPATNTGLAHYLEHMMFKGTDKYGSLDWTKEKVELDKIDALYEQYNKTTDEVKRKAIYRKIDSISGVAAKFAIANEYDKMMSAMGAQNTNAFTSFEQTVYTDDVPSSSLDKYLKVQAERFRNPILRIFHTELEAVYEEKNRSLDSDGSKVFETLFANLFKNHNYGKQTTIGTVEHLKNPSLVEIRKYFNTYYVPNNMGIIMSGDFNPDEVIKKIDQSFGYMKYSPVPKYTFSPETPTNQPIIKEIVGPDAEGLTMGFRLPGNKDKDVLLADLVGQILTNGKAGLLDLNLVKKQKLLSAGAFSFLLIDHGVLYISAKPTSGQSLEEVKDLVLNEIDNLKKGNFDDQLITSIVNNMKKMKIKDSENYGDRASVLMDAFTSELDWKDQVAYVNNLSKITKQQVVDFANKYLGNNYVAVLKRKGEKPESIKIEKPEITPVETNADKQSDFVKIVASMPSNSSKPVFLDYNKDLKKSKLAQAEVLYVPNQDNSLFRLMYRYKIGSLNDLKQSIASQYIQFLGTDKKSSEAISKEFYKIASSFKVSTGEEYTTVTIEGLQENFDQAVSLYEDLVLNAKPDETALTNLKARLMKGRKDAKLNKNAILQGLTSYATYGADNKFNYVLSDDELNKITADELVARIKQLNSYEQTIIYYGPEKLNVLVNKLSKLHKMPSTLAKPNPAKVFTQVKQDKNQVLFADYDMVQAETRWIRNTDLYDPNKTALVKVFNNYFGGGMGAIVFQTIRESKALAYSTFAYYVQPSKKEEKYTLLGYVGSQSDKFNEATASMNELLNKLPELPENLNLAKGQTKKDIETERITQDGIIFNYLETQRLGLKEDIRKVIYQTVDKINFADLKNFHQNYLANQPYTYAIVASKDKVKEEDMKKLGELKKLSLEEIFGY